MESETQIRILALLRAAPSLCLRVLGHKMETVLTLGCSANSVVCSLCTWSTATGTLFMLHNTGSYHHDHSYYHYSSNCREYLKTPWSHYLWVGNSGEEWKNKSERDTFTVTDKTRLDFCILSVRCPMPLPHHQAHGSRCSERAEGHISADGNKKALPTRHSREPQPDKQHQPNRSGF